MDCGSIMLINDIWSSMANTDAGPTDCLKLTSFCSDKILLETKKKKNKIKTKHLSKEKSTKSNKDKNIVSSEKEKKKKKCKDKSLKLNLLEQSFKTKEKVNEIPFLDKLKQCKTNSINLLLAGKRMNEKEKKVSCDFTETHAAVKSEDVRDELAVADNKNKKEFVDSISQADTSVQSMCKDSCISGSDSKDNITICTEDVLFNETSKSLIIKETSAVKDLIEKSSEEKEAREDPSELTVESSVIKTENIESDTSIVEVINDDRNEEEHNSTNISEKVVGEALDVSKVAHEIEIGSEPQDITQEVCIIEENRDNESLDSLLVKDPSPSFTNTLNMPCQESFSSSKDCQSEIQTSFSRDICFGDNFFTLPTFSEGNEDLVSQLLSEWPPQTGGFDLPKDHDSYFPTVLLRNDIVFGGLFPEATIDNDEVSDEDVNNSYHGQSQFTRGAKVAFGEMATVEETETEWAEQDFESTSPVSRSVIHPSPVPTVSESSPAAVPILQKQYDGKISQEKVGVEVGSKKCEIPSKSVSEEDCTANRSMPQSRQMPPTLERQTTETASKPVPKTNKEKSISKGMFTPESMSLHDRTVYRDHMHYITQQKFRIFYLSKDAPVDSPIPYPTEISPHTYRPVMRCPCSLCYANHMALIANYNSLTQYRNVRLRNDAEMRKSQNEELLRRIEESLIDAKPAAAAEPVVDEDTKKTCCVNEPKVSNEIDTSLPIKKRKTFIQTPLKPESSRVLPSYPCTPMISIAQLEINGSHDKQKLSKTAEDHNTVVPTKTKNPGKNRKSQKVPSTPLTVNSTKMTSSNQSDKESLNLKVKTAAKSKGNCVGLDDDQSVAAAAQNLISLAQNSRKRKSVILENSVISTNCAENEASNVKKSHRHHHRSKRSKQDKQERRERKKKRKLENS